MKAYAIFADCGDYYCEGWHLVAVTLNPDEIPELIQAAEKSTGTAANGEKFKWWSEVDQDPTEIVLGELIYP